MARRHPLYPTSAHTRIACPIQSFSNVREPYQVMFSLRSIVQNQEKKWVKTNFKMSNLQSVPKNCEWKCIRKKVILRNVHHWWSQRGNKLLTPCWLKFLMSAKKEVKKKILLLSKQAWLTWSLTRLWISMMHFNYSWIRICGRIGCITYQNLQMLSCCFI